MKDNSQYFNDNLPLLRSKTWWEHCSSFLHKNHKQVEYTLGVFHNLLGNLCRNDSIGITVFFVQIILHCLVDLQKAFFIYQTREKKPNTRTNFIHFTSSFALLPLFQLFAHFRHLSSRVWKVLTQNWEQRIWGQASPSRAELVGLSRAGHRRAQTWCWQHCQ